MYIEYIDNNKNIIIKKEYNLIKNYKKRQIFKKKQKKIANKKNLNFVLLLKITWF